jgi:hypothetical protein
MYGFVVGFSSTIVVCRLFFVPLSFMALWWGGLSCGECKFEPRYDRWEDQFIVHDDRITMHGFGYVGEGLALSASITSNRNNDATLTDCRISLSATAACAIELIGRASL